MTIFQPRHRLTMFVLTMFVLTRFVFGLVLLYASAMLAQSSRPQPSVSAGGGQFRIAGTVVNGLGGNPLTRARVSIVDTRNPQSSQSVLASEDGHFQFTQLAPGKYAMQGAKRGFISASYDQHEQYSTAIVTGAGLDTEHLLLRLMPSAAISGKILDESGDPVRDATVSLYLQSHRSGINHIRTIRTDRTDDLGSFEFISLDGGTYFIAVNAKPWYALHPASQSAASGSAAVVDRSFDVAYPTTYYADATEADSATPIPVKGGDRVEIEIHLSPVPALHILFHAPDQGTQGFSWPAIQKSGLDEMEDVQPDGMQMVSQGVYEMTGVPAGRYSVRMGAGNGQMNALSEVDLTSDGQELDAASGVQASTVEATVHMLGRAARPQHLVILLRSENGTVLNQVEVDANGQAHFQDVIPGKYDVLAFSTEQAYSIVRIASPSGETSGHAVNVTPGSALDLSLLVVGSAVTVEGFARRSGKAVPGAMVVLVPKDPAANHELFRRDQSDLDGSFILHDVLPGTYTVVAIENGWDLDWAKPAVIAGYRRHGQTVVIRDQTNAAVHLPDSVEVQTR